MSNTVFIGLGSNLRDPLQQLRSAFCALGALSGCELIAQSSLYRSRPMGPQDQPDYLNAVVAIGTALQPLLLLERMQEIEQQQGRVREGERWGARTLDLDMLLYGDLEQDDPRLTLPHPGMHLRNFVLYPLFEIAPRLRVPGHGPLRALLSQVEEDGLQRIEEGLQG